LLSTANNQKNIWIAEAEFYIAEKKVFFQVGLASEKLLLGFSSGVSP